MSSPISDPIKIVVKPLPLKPTILKEERPDRFILSSSSEVNNQWFLNDTLLATTTSSIIEPERLGNYTVQVSENGCKSVSKSVIVKMEKPELTLEGEKTICEGDSVKITAPIGYSSYLFSDGNVDISTSQNEFTITNTGVYSVVAQRGKFDSPASGSIAIVVTPLPKVPIITKQDQPNQFVLTSNGLGEHNWFRNDTLVSSANDTIYTPRKLGSYRVMTTLNGCSSISLEVVVTMAKPILSFGEESAFCEGDSLILNAPIGFGKYIFLIDSTQLITTENRLIASRAGVYSVSTQRGNFISEFSDPVNVIVKSLPPKPTVTRETNGLKSSSLLSKQWFENGVILQDSTTQFLQVGFGNYTVRVEENGCYSESESFIITANEPTYTELPIKLYPNPNSGEFSVLLPKGIHTWQTLIFDMKGRIVFESNHINDFSGKEEIKLIGQKGMLLLKVSSSEKSQTLRLLVE